MPGLEIQKLAQPLTRAGNGPESARPAREVEQQTDAAADQRALVAPPRLVPQDRAEASAAPRSFDAVASSSMLA